jgi:hypothetical protein
MRNVLLKLLGIGTILGFVTLPASANSVNLTLNGSGTIGIASTGSGNLRLCLGSGSCNALAFTAVGTGDFTGITSFRISASGPISLWPVGPDSVFANASLSGITFSGGDIDGTFSSMIVSQTSSQVSSGMAKISGTGAITSVAGLRVNVPFNFSGTINVGADVSIGALPGGGTTGEVIPTPEPGILALATTGLLLFGGVFWRRFAF